MSNLENKIITLLKPWLDMVVSWKGDGIEYNVDFNNTNLNIIKKQMFPKKINYRGFIFTVAHLSYDPQRLEDGIWGQLLLINKEKTACQSIKEQLQLCV